MNAAAGSVSSLSNSTATKSSREWSAGVTVSFNYLFEALEVLDSTFFSDFESAF